MTERTDRIASYLPWLGLVLIAAGLVVVGITRRFELATNLLLAGGALLLLLYAVIRPDELRELASGRYARYGLSTVLAILFFAAIAALLYWIAYQNEDWRWDTTEAGEFTPPAEMVSLLEDLDEPIHVIGFYPISMAMQQDQARSLLDNLAAVSDEISYEFQDPEANPLAAEQYELNFYGTLVFIRNQGTEDEVYARANSLSDRDIYSALLKVVNPVEKKLYLLTGHGEPSVEPGAPDGMATVVGLLEDQGFTVEQLNLFTAGEVPEDATLIGLIGPQAPLDPAELAAIQSYLDNGGAAFIARDVVDSEGRQAAEEDGLNAYLKDTWGLELRNDVIIDQDLARAGQTFGLEFLAADYGTSPIITQELRDFGTRFSVARSINPDPESPTMPTVLVRTSPDAWGETDIAQLVQNGIAEPDAADAQGDLAVGVSATNPESEARLVLFGDADFVRDTNLAWGGNAILFSNALNWLAEDEVAIELTPRETIQRQLNIPEQQLRLLRLLSTWGGPLLMAAIGFVVWSSRRRTV